MMGKSFLVLSTFARAEDELNTGDGCPATYWKYQSEDCQCTDTNGHYCLNDLSVNSASAALACCQKRYPGLCTPTSPVQVLLCSNVFDVEAIEDSPPVQAVDELTMTGDSCPAEYWKYQSEDCQCTDTKGHYCLNDLSVNSASAALACCQKRYPGLCTPTSPVKVPLCSNVLDVEAIEDSPPVQAEDELTMTGDSCPATYWKYQSEDCQCTDTKGHYCLNDLSVNSASAALACCQKRYPGLCTPTSPVKVPLCSNVLDVEAMEDSPPVQAEDELTMTGDSCPAEYWKYQSEDCQCTDTKGHYCLNDLSVNSASAALACCQKRYPGLCTPTSPVKVPLCSDVLEVNGSAQILV